jgi:hypothetical protein
MHHAALRWSTEARRTPRGNLVALSHGGMTPKKILREPSGCCVSGSLAIQIDPRWIAVRACSARIRTPMISAPNRASAVLPLAQR